MTNAESLPMKALSDIPNPNPNAKKIVALVKESGRVSGYKLSDDRIVSKEEGVELARQGEIRGVGISSRNGNEYLKSLPDDDEGNNLSSLPTVKGGEENGQSRHETSGSERPARHRKQPQNTQAQE